jgi:hypothetical protein
MNVIPVFNENDAILSSMPLLVGLSEPSFVAVTSCHCQPHSCFRQHLRAHNPPSASRLIVREVNGSC